MVGSTYGSGVRAAGYLFLSKYNRLLYTHAGNLRSMSSYEYNEDDNEYSYNEEENSEDS